MEQKTAKERLVYYITNILRLSQADFEYFMGVDKYVKTYTGNPRADTRKKMEDSYPALNIDWVNTGEGEMIKPDYKNKPDVIIKHINPKLAKNGKRYIQELEAEIERLKRELERKEVLLIQRDKEKDTFLKKIIEWTHDFSQKC